MSNKSGQTTDLKKVSMNALEVLAPLTKDITLALKDVKDAKNPQAVQHKQKVLKEKVFTCMNAVASAMNQKAIKADPTGLMLCNSSWGEEVNNIAKQWLAETQKLNPKSEIGEANKLMLQQAEATGFLGNLVLKTKRGATMVWNGIKKTITFIWNGIKAIYSWLKEKVLSFFAWVKSVFVNFLGKASNDGTIDCQAILSEGENLNTKENKEAQETKEKEKEDAIIQAAA
mgnify:FL=1